MKRYVKELILVLLLLVPYVYLATFWNQLPEQVPTHFDADGNPDDYSSRYFLLFLPAGVGIITYLVLRIIPILDPKKKIQLMGEKYYSFRFVFSIFFALFACYLLYITKQGGMDSPNILIGIIAAMVAVMGNYFQAIRPNYFIGIRTPWTLESERVWKNTHRLGGRLWMGGGILLLILCIVLRNSTAISIAAVAVMCIIVLIPVIYSYVDYKRLRTN